MALDKFVELLSALGNADNNARQQAEQMYQQAKQSEPESLVLGLTAVLANSQVKESIRRHSGVLLRQLITPGAEKDFAYAKLSLQSKQQLATELLRMFEQETLPKVKGNMGDAISKLAEYVCNPEDPRGSLSPGSHGAAGWPALLPTLFRLANASDAAASVEGCDAALRLLLDVLPTLKADIVAAQQDLARLLQASLEHADIRLRCAAVLLVCGLVQYTDQGGWSSLLPTAPVMTQVVRQLAEAGKEESLDETLQALTDVVTWQPDFFKPQLSQGMEPANLMATLAKSKDNLPNGTRNLALEWLVSMFEKREKWLSKNVPQFLPILIETCMNFLLEVDSEEEEVKAWAARMDDEEGDEDEDELMHTGEQAVDRVAAAGELEVLGPPLFQLIVHFTSQESWQAKHAGLAAMKQTVEYLEDKAQVDEMAKLILQHVEHFHPRVRFMALYALGQLSNDQAPTFQEGWHQTVMPILLKAMDDPVDRVAAMAMSAFVSFGEALDNTLMQTYCHNFMEKVVSKLQTSQHRGVREESITCVAVIAGNIRQEFSKYYDSIMPVLKQFVMHFTGEKENRLRGKSFECMSLLGVAVGKEKFLPDAREALSEMFSKPVEDDDLQREYIKEASDRICQCLKQDFAQFLPGLLPGILRTLQFDQVAERGEQQDNADMYCRITVGEGALVMVHSQKFEEMKTSLQLLLTFCHEVEGSFFDFAQATAEALLPLLANTDEDFTTWCGEVRGIGLQVWAQLIKVARQGARDRGISPDLAGQLLSTGLRTTFGLLDKIKEPETLSAVASGIAESFRSVGQGAVQASEIGQIVDKMLDCIDRSLVRTAKLTKGKVKHHDDDDYEEDDEEHEEEQFRRNCEEVLGAVLEVASTEFPDACIHKCGEKIGEWLKTTQNKVLGLYLACDILLHLKERSLPLWPVFMEQVFATLSAGPKEDPDAKLAAAYAVNVAAKVPAFSQAAPEAYRRLAKIVGGPRPKKRDIGVRKAMDNAVAALISLTQEQPAACPPDIQAWNLILAKLPLRDDEHESQKVHARVVDLVLKQDQGLLGASNQNLGLVLSALAEVYGARNICEEETDEKILKVFQSIPRETLLGAASNFTEKQQKKVEKMLLR